MLEQLIPFFKCGIEEGVCEEWANPEIIEVLMRRFGERFPSCQIVRPLRFFRPEATHWDIRVMLPNGGLRTINQDD